MVFMPHDLDQLMKRQSLGLLPTARGLTSQAVLNTPELRARYLARACDLVTNVFVVPRLTNRVDEAVVALLPTIRAYDGELASNFVATAGELKSRIIGRGLKLQRQLDIVNGRIAPVAFRDGTARLANSMRASGNSPMNRAASKRGKPGTFAEPSPEAPS